MRSPCVVPGGLDPAVGTLDVRDAELVDMAVEEVGDGGYVPCITLTGSGVRRAQARLADRRGEHRPEPVLSEPHRLRAATDPPSE
jgi:hypothetical protein